MILATASPTFAASNNEVANFASQTLSTLTILASLAAVIFLIKGGYAYITSNGRPEALEQAKKTIRNALIGLLFVVGAGVFSSLLSHAFTTPSIPTTPSQIALTPIEPVSPSGGLGQVLTDAIIGLLQNIIQSSTKPIMDGIINFLTTTPSVTDNSVVFNFWLTILGITDSLFAIIIAVLGFHFMSASTLGFEEIELKHLLPRIGLAFLGANTSIFLINWIISVCNTLVQAILHATGGINSAWVLTAFDPLAVTSGTTSLITLIFMLLFVILAVVLLLFYIIRLIIISLGAVLAPLIFLLWVIPRFSDFAEISIRTYIVSIFTVFIHVVIIQLASAFLTIPGQAGTNSFISILVGIAMLFTLLKTPQAMMQFAFYTSVSGSMRKIGGQVMNVINTQTTQRSAASTKVTKITPRKVIAA